MSLWSCLADSFAECMGMDKLWVYEAIGHDGSEIIWPDLPDPYCRRGFHPQELIDMAWNHGWAVTSFEVHPQSASFDGRISDVWREKTISDRIHLILRNPNIVVCGMTKDGRLHATTQRNELDGFAIQHIFAFSKRC